MNGTAEERKASFLAMSPEKRAQVLGVVGPNVLEGLPELQQEAKMLRQKQQDERTKEMRKLRPPLNELLTPEQIRAAHGTLEQREALFKSLDATKRLQVAGALPPTALADFPELRRMVALSRTPRQVPMADLREAKIYRALYSNRQLEEVLTDFWFNHFNVFEGKGQAGAGNFGQLRKRCDSPARAGAFQRPVAGNGAASRHAALSGQLDIPG